MENKAKKILHSLDKYVAIGFDVDHCLIRYKVKELFPLAYKSLVKVLVEEKGYPKEILDFGKKEKCFIMNGLIIDFKTSYILKLGENKEILRAYFGYDRVSHDDLVAKYGSPPRFEIFDPYECRTAEYVCCLTFYECYIPAILAHMIDYNKKTKKPEEIDAKAIMKDAMHALVANYAHYNKDIYHPVHTYGNMFPELITNIDKIIYKQDKMKEMLNILKARGKILFICSNSHYEFVNYLMEYAFGKDWLKLFDFVVPKSNKPLFFSSEDMHFHEIDESIQSRIGKPTTHLTQNEMFTDGNAKILEENIKRVTGGKDGRILFFGDNYSTDVLAAERIAHWDAVCIMEELGDVDFGEGYDESYWGHWQYEDTPNGRIPTFWYSYMSKNVAMCTSLTDSIEMAAFYEI